MVKTLFDLNFILPLLELALAMESELTNKQKPTSSKLIIVIIAMILLFCCLVTVCLIGAGLLVFSTSSSIISQPTNNQPDSFVKISVDEDGCGVLREEIQGSSSVSSITWVITDINGYSVLERNAENEYQYSYFESGTYFVKIKAWFNGAYHQISDEVIINCK